MRSPSTRRPKPIPATDLAAVLRAAIAASGLTHYRLGKDAGVSPTVIDRFVSGERDLRLDMARANDRGIQPKRFLDGRASRSYFVLTSRRGVHRTTVGGW